MVKSFLYFFLFIFSTVLLAQDCPDTRLLAVSRGERPANTSEPLMLSDGNEGFWMVFQSRDFEGNFSRIKVQRVSPLGEPLLGEGGLEVSDAAGNQSEVRVITDSFHDLILVWKQSKDSETGDIYIQKIQMQGDRRFGQSGLQVCATIGNQKAPAIALGEYGNIYVAWEDERAGEGKTRIYSQCIRSEGIMAWHPDGLRVHQNESLSKRPLLCEDSRGGVYIVWEDYRAGNAWQLWFQSIEPNGSFRFTEQGMPAFRPDASAQTNASILPDGYAGFFVVCEKMDVRNYETDIYYSRVNHNGHIQYQFAACSAFGDQVNPTLTIRNYEIILIWEDKRNGDWDIYGQYLSVVTGSPQWEHNGLPLAAHPYHQQNPGIIATIEFNDIMICWQTEDRVYAQKLSNFGEALWKPEGVQICTDRAAQKKPVICRNGNGGSWVAWTDFRHGTGPRVYFQHLNMHGMLLQKATGTTFIREQDGSNSSGIEQMQVLTVNGNTSWLVWEDYRQGDANPDIYLTRYHPLLHFETIETGIPVCAAPFEQTRPVLASDGKAGAWIAWIDRRNGKDEDIYIQHINSNGVFTFDIGGIPVVKAPRSQAQIQLKADGSGGVWIAWTDARQYDAQGFDVYVQRINASGKKQFEENGKRLTYGSHDSHTPVMEVNDAGNMGLVWMDNRSGYFNIWMQVIDKYNQPVFQGEGRVAYSSEAHQRQPALAALRNEWVLAWSEERMGQSKDKVYWLRIDAQAQPYLRMKPLLLSHAPDRQVKPAVYPGDEEDCLFVWQEISGVLSEGVKLKSRRVATDAPEIGMGSGRLVARMMHELQGASVVWHTDAQMWLMGWTEAKTRPAAAWSQDSDIHKPIPDQYPLVCNSRFEQGNTKLAPALKNECSVFWIEKRDDYHKLFVRKVRVE